MDAPAPNADDAILEHRFSRQIYSIGRLAHAELSRARVLLLGLKGVGSEIAKNLLLMGVPCLAICDEDLVTAATPSFQFLVRDEHVGTNIVDASLAELRSLAPTSCISRVAAAPSSLPADLSHFSVVVVADQWGAREDVEAISARCHREDVPLVVAQVRGAFARLFCDFGPDFVVTEDPSFEHRILQAQAQCCGGANSQDEGADMSQDCSQVRLLAEPDELGRLAPGQQVHICGTVAAASGDDPALQLLQVEIAAVNAQEATLTLRVPAARLRAKDALGMYVREVPRRTRYSHAALGDVLQKPFNGRLPRSRVDHQCFLALDRFLERHDGAPPRTHEEVAELVQLAVDLSPGQVDAATARTFARGCQGKPPPLMAVVGGLGAHEVVKCLSGKGHPINQLAYLSEPSLVADDHQHQQDDATTGRDYTSTAMNEASFIHPSAPLLGRDVQERITNLRLLLVGCGAVGCELLKNLALLGVATGARGRLHATDPDHIEPSNLCRQFLFRDQDVRRPKSEVASRRARQINPRMLLTAHDARVGPDTEDRFTEDFFAGLDAVCNALDNFETRFYVDKRCTVAKKPLIDPGTDGLEMSLKVIIPWVTATFGEQVQPQQEDRRIPICTLRSFPTKSEHTLMWAKDRFAYHFTKSPLALQTYLRGVPLPHHQDQKQLLGFWHRGELFTFADCVLWARALFEDSFTTDIECLLTLHPPDSRSESGELFWNEFRLQPSPLRFDISDEAHIAFIRAAANLKALTLGLEPDERQTTPAAAVLREHDDAWQRYPVKNTGYTKAADGDEAELPDENEEGLQLHIPPRQDAARKVGPSTSIVSLEVDKDDDVHMKFIAAAANLRSGNYGIRTLALNEARRVVGHIIPSIVTTTAVVAGLAALELVKLVKQGIIVAPVHHGDHHDPAVTAAVTAAWNRNGGGSSHEYCWLLSRPAGWFGLPVRRNVEEVAFGRKVITSWDTPVFPDMTLRQLIDEIRRIYGVETVCSVISDKAMVFDLLMHSEQTRQERLGKRMSELWAMTSAQEGSNTTKQLLAFSVAAEEAPENYLTALIARK